jgi:hypothetical protein
MQKYENKIVRLVLLLWLLCGVGHTVLPMHGSDRSDQSRYWGYQPVYNSSSSAPTYQFRTTSIYIRSLGESGSNSTMYCPGNIRRTTTPTNPFDWTDEDDPTGVVPDPVPLGDSPWAFLLLLSVLYLALRHHRRSAFSSLAVICAFVSGVLSP